MGINMSAQGKKRDLKVTPTVLPLTDMFTATFPKKKKGVGRPRRETNGPNITKTAP